MSLDKSTIELLAPFKSEEKPESKPDWYKEGSDVLKHFFDTAESEYRRIVKELEQDSSPANARKIKNLNVSADDMRVYLNRKGLVETANEVSSIRVTRSLTNRSSTTPQVRELVLELDNFDAKIQSKYKPGGKHQVSRSSLEKARLEAEKRLKEFDIELARELNKSLQDNTLFKASNEAQIQNKNLITENESLMTRIQELEVTNASYKKQLAQASAMNRELRNLQREVAKIAAESALLKSGKSDE